MKKVGINDIAVELGISRNTVSKVMNNRGYVSDNIKNKIIDTAVKMGYAKLPSELLEEYGSIERSYDSVSKLSKNILVVATSPDFSNFWGKMIKGISEQLVLDNYKCLYNFITFEEAENFEFPQIINKGDIAGIILINVYNKETIKKITKSGIPAVYFDSSLDVDISDVQADTVLVEGRRSIYKITKTLISQGDKKIGFFGDITYCKSIEERWEGFVKAHRDNKIEINMDYCFTGGKKGHFYYEREIESVVENFIKENKSFPDAFVCANDHIAIKLIKEFKKYNISVPEDVRVSGFDDMESFGDIESLDKDKLLTTVSIDIQEIGERLAKQIEYRVENLNKHFEEVKICGTVKFRKSTNKAGL